MVDLYELDYNFIYFLDICLFTQQYLLTVTKAKVKESYKYCNWTRIHEKEKLYTKIVVIHIII